jgi:hypothetical protein
MSIMMTDMQKYKELKELVESSYTSKTEAELIWRSIRWNLIAPNGYEIIDERLEMYSAFLETGKPLCHLDFEVNKDEDDPFFDALERPYVSTPCYEFSLGYISEAKRHYRFLFVNPSVNGPEDFSFMNKLALKDTYIFATCEKSKTENTLEFGPVPLHTRDCTNIRFIVQCSVDSSKCRFRYKQMLEVKDFLITEKSGEPTVSFSATPFENKETDLQNQFNSRINRKFATNAELREQKSQLGIWKWSDVIKYYAF